MKLRSGLGRAGRNRLWLGATLIEVLVSVTLLMTSTSSIVTGYVFSATRAEWSAYSLAAHSLARQRVEQSRAAKWDPYGYPSKDQLQGTNFPIVVEVLDVPVSGSNTVFATNFTTISTVTENPPLRLVRVDCVWRFSNQKLFTNTVVCYRAPDQ